MVIQEICRSVEEEGHPWQEPAITNSSEGEVMIEWNKLPYSLTLFITAESTDILRVWGPDMDHDMKEEKNVSDVQAVEAYRWLMKSR